MFAVGSTIQPLVPKVSLQALHGSKLLKISFAHSVA